MQVEAAEAPYPTGAHGDAVVVLELEINKDGTVGEVRVKSGEEPFAEIARTTAQQWKFAPATRGGIPIRARIHAKVTFREPTPPPPITIAKPDELPKPLPPPPPKPPVEIKVVGEEREELGSTHIPKRETRLVPGAFADPFRVVEVMPGVAPILSGLPYFFVRGSPPGNVGYFIDNIRVPILFHVGAGPSVIAPALVERVDLYPAAYPTRFGRYSGGVMAGETTTPSAVARGEAQARIFDAGVFVETPFAGGKGHALMGGRYSYMGALLAAVAPDYGLGYGDYQARVGYALSDRDRLSVFAFGAFDRLSNEQIKRTLFDVEFHRVDLRWDRATDGGRIRLATTLSWDRTLDASESRSVPDAMSRSSGVRTRLELDQRVARGIRVRGGGDIGVERIMADRERRGLRVLERLLRSDAIEYPVRNDGYGGAWIDAILRPIGRVEIVPGLRVDVHRMRGEDFLFFEPRVTGRVRVAQGVAWISAFGVAHQLPTATIRVPGRSPGGLETVPQEAFQASQGIEVALPAKMLARATFFRTHVLAPRADVEARNYGVELFIRRDFTERLGGFLAYTVSRAERIAGRATFPSDFDRTHVLSAVLGYDLGRGFRIGTRFYYASGRPWFLGCPTPDCGPADPTAPRPYTRQGRFPYFARLDVRFEKRWTLSRGAWFAATFEWFNALLASETEDVDWDSVRGGIAYYNRSPLTIPSIGVEAGF